MTEVFDWSTVAAPVFVLGFSLLLGLIMAVRGWGTGSPAEAARAAARQADHEALLARKEALLERIRELDAERGRLPEAERLRRREALLAEATEVLKALDDVEAAAGLGGDPVGAGEAGGAPVAPRSRERSAGSGLLTGVVFVVVVAAIGLMLGRYSGQRAPGQSMTGNTSQSELQAAIDEAQATLEQDPTHLPSLNLLTYVAILQRDATNAMALVDRARAVDPDHPEVLLHLGILRLMVGMSEQALPVIQQAVDGDPELHRALVWRGMAELALGQREEAAATITLALQGDLMPVEQQLATQLLADAKAPPPVDRLAGSLRIAEGLAAPGTGAVFLIVRSGPEAVGPPLASKRLPAATLQGSVDFVLTDQDRMLGGDWPEEVWLSARLDRDGDPMTRDPSDLVAAVQGPLASGSTGLELVLAAQEGVDPESLAGAGDDPAEAAEAAEPEGDGASEVRVRGRLTLAEGTELPDGGVLFLIAQRAQAGGGPPVAVVKVSGPELSFPLDFSLDEGDMMMPGAWPAEVWVKARLDADGDAMSRSEADVEAPVVGPLGAGAAPIVLVLGGPQG